MKFLIILFLAVTVAVALEQAFVITERIINGQPALPGQFPYQVYLEAEVTCGGSLISSTWVLTAAHCVEGARYVDVSLGGIEKLNFDVYFTVKSGNVILHENYDEGTVSNDIALIKIPRVRFTKNIQKIDLPKETPSEVQYINESVIISGWGRVTGDKANSNLQFGLTRVISNDECDKIVDGEGNITPKKLCVQSVNRVGTCFGDSGGPVVLSDSKILIGIASYIFGRGYELHNSTACELGYPTVFTRVTSYLDWIADRTGIQY